MRIAKFIANAGICSRRAAERLIEDGEVSVDGEVIDSPALNISDENIIKVGGKLVGAIPKARLWVYYKPLGLITTNSDPQDRPTIFQALEGKLPRVISVGRLDINSEGLLLLTNNGDLSRYLESPSTNCERIYKVRTFGKGREVAIRNKKIVIDGVNYHPKLISLTKKTVSNSWYKVVLTEGKNREIRRLFEHFGFEVSRLIRTDFGKYSLGNMKPGDLLEVTIDQNYSWKT
ncbi:MAG: pseudouridine synthase [Rickettsiales bacterium]|nr:MAG: pseudouridine synthase [Rickettsiales bacterium]